MNIIRINDGYQYEIEVYRALIEKYFPNAVNPTDVEYIEEVCEKLRMSPEALVELVYELNDWLPDTSM